MGLASLFGFFRKKEISVQDFGAEGIVFVTDRDAIQTAQKSLRGRGIESHDRIETELMYVRAFAVVTAIGEALNHDERSERASRSFISFLGQSHADPSKRSALGETSKAKNRRIRGCLRKEFARRAPMECWKALEL